MGQAVDGTDREPFCPEVTYSNSSWFLVVNQLRIVTSHKVVGMAVEKLTACLILCL